MRSKRTIFDVFCADKRLTRFCSGFCIIFSHKINENLMKTSRYLFTPSLVFLNMATLTKHRILRYESYFFIFLSFVFFSKKTSKKHSKIQVALIPSKNTKKWFRGMRFGSQNGTELTPEAPKISRIVPKSRFLTNPFLDHFFRQQNMVSRRHERLRGV